MLVEIVPENVHRHPAAVVGNDELSIYRNLSLSSEHFSIAWRSANLRISVARRASYRTVVSQCQLQSIRLIDFTWFFSISRFLKFRRQDNALLFSLKHLNILFSITANRANMHLLVPSLQVPTSFIRFHFKNRNTTPPAHWSSIEMSPASDDIPMPDACLNVGLVSNNI